MKIINNQLTSPMMNLLKEILGSSKTAERAIKPFVMARKNSCHGTLKLLQRLAEGLNMSLKVEFVPKSSAVVK